MTQIRIAPDGRVRGLWTDEIDWPSLGKAAVKRASHVEFCEQEQLWYVRDSHARNSLRACLEIVLRRPLGDVLHWSGSRTEALAWERDYFSPGGPGWRSSPSYRRQIRVAGCTSNTKDNRFMDVLRLLFSLLSGGHGGRQHVSDHNRRQAYGPRWTRHRRRHIASYRRRRPRFKRQHASR